MRIEEEIARIREEILKLHGVAKRAVELCFKAMKDKSVVKEISKLEEVSDELEAKIHDSCAHFIVRFHPMAKDMRFVLGAMRISSAYERIVDLAQEISLYECEFREEIFEAERPLLEMFGVVEKSFEGVEKIEEKMPRLDDEVDEVYRRLLEEIEGDFKCVEEVLAVRHIERIGDLPCIKESGCG